MEGSHHSSRRPFWAIVAILAVVTGVWWFALQFVSDHETAWNFWFNAAYGTTYAFAGLLLLARMWHWRSKQYADTIALSFVAVGFLFDGLAQFVWTYYNVAFGIEIVAASIADIFYVSAVILFAVGFPILLMHRIRPKPLSGWLSVVVSLLAIALSITASVFMVDVLPQVEGSLLNFNTFYIAASSFIVLIGALNIYRDWHAELRPYLFWMLVSFAMTGFGDALFGVRDFLGVYWNGDIADGLYALGALGFLSCYGLLPARLTHITETVEDRRPLFRMSFLFTLSLILAGFVIAGGMAGLMYTDRLKVAEDKILLQTLQVSEVFQVSFMYMHGQAQALVGFFEGNEMVTEEEFQLFTSSVTKDSETVSSLSFIGQDDRVRFSTEPTLVGVEYARESMRRNLLAQVREEDKIIVSEPLILFEGVPGVLILVPIHKDGSYAGTALVSVHLPEFLETVLGSITEQTAVRFWFSTRNRLISLNGSEIYDRDGRRIIDAFGTTAMTPSVGPPPQGEPLSFTDAIFVGDAPWFLTASPRPGVFDDAFLVAAMIFFSVAAGQSILTIFMYFVFVQQAHLRGEIAMAKNQFVALVSHQLRAPMTQLRWMIEQLKEQPRLPNNVREQLESMEEIVRAENDLVGDVLNVSRIERGVLKLELADVPVREMLAEAVKPLEKIAKNKQMRVLLPDVKTNVRVRVDREKIAEAIRNIVDNAIKFGPHHSTVTLRTGNEDPRFVTVTVRDQGAGIPEESWPTLFEIKTSSSFAPATGTVTGAGLGLFLTKKFVEAVGGDVRFETSSKGTTFFIRLPRSKS